MRSKNRRPVVQMMIEVFLVQGLKERGGGLFRVWGFGNLVKSMEEREFWVLELGREVCSCSLSFS